ncbi:complement factor H-like isoform X1 [Branchiostoma floridae]|uniref:Complement factor H-like isoform X1 n=1 Tax=Branchiostoma floridae TaxID=7739 RepID=A0A9J7LSC6_BRAFL|nr:complement factor H-like isoform X1 [Branchiostoma floridae]
MSRLAVGVLLLAVVGLLGPRWVSADEHSDEHLELDEHADEHLESDGHSDDAHGHDEEHAEEHTHECLEGYEEFEGHCYYFSDTTATFSEAVAQCEAMDGYLAAPDCHDEHAAEFFYRATAWISMATEEGCEGGQQSIDTELPFICLHAPTCGEPPVMNNTVISGCEPPYDQQEVCRYICGPGFHLFEGTVSSATATCLDGKWHGPFMVCNSNCPDPPLNPGVTTLGDNCEEPYITGDMCSFECMDGYDLVSGDHDMSCIDGRWIHAATDLPGDPLVCE